MCDPISIAAAAVSTGFKVAGDISAHKAQNKAAAENKSNALSAFVENVRGLNLRGLQEQEGSAQAVEQATMQNQTEIGMANAGAAASGIEGNSVAAQAQSLNRGLSTFKSTSLINLDRILQQLEAEKAGAATAAQGRINAVPKASMGSTLLGIGGAVAGGITDLLTRRSPNVARGSSAALPSPADVNAGIAKGVKLG
jgi:hypothetical protein